ncbi:MAG: LamG domain-containing protein, partial [Armatimonadetes bacterium]|nr:LamG domain-containing protein [Armatimonadota bacterium]
MSTKCLRWLTVILFALVSVASAQSPLAKNFADRLTLYLPFDGDANALVAKGNPMEMAGGFEVTFVQGKIGQAVECGHKGKNRFLSYLTTSANFKPNIYAQQGTIAFWVKPNWNGNETSERFRHFFSIRSGLFYLYWHRSALTFSSTIRSKAKHHYAPSASVAHWKAGEWHHVAVTWWRDEKTLVGFKRIFLDGQLAGEARDVLMDFELTGALIIGGLDGSETFERLADAAIDEFAVWERVLNEDEIAQLMQMGREGQGLKDLPSVQRLAKSTRERLPKPLPPQKGNLLSNASFEVGTRPYRASNMSLRLDEKTKVHGERSACFDASHWTGTTILTSGLFSARSKILHTFSLWLKAEREDVPVRFGIYSAYVGGSEVYERIFYGLETQTKISTQWQRYQVTGELPPSPNNLYFVQIAVTSSQ